MAWQSGVNMDCLGTIKGRGSLFNVWQILGETQGPYLVRRLERHGGRDQGVHEVQHKARYAFFLACNTPRFIMWDSFQTKLLW